jgi:hypothetical protein
MPRWYRPGPNYKPRPLAQLINQAGNVSTADEGSIGNGNVNTRAVDANAGEVIAVNGSERMNQRNKGGRERFFA